MWETRVQSLGQEDPLEEEMATRSSILAWEIPMDTEACQGAVHGVAGSIPGGGRSPGVGNGNPLQDSCLDNPRDRGAWQATVHGVTKELDMTQKLSTHTLN